LGSPYSGPSAGRILFVSGWAGYPALFPGLEHKALFIHPFVSHDLRSIRRCLSEKAWDMVIAWSLGAHLCLKTAEKINSRHLFLIAPFLDFTRHTPAAEIQTMLTGMRKNPFSTVRWFWRTCGIRDKPLIPLADVPALEQGLKFLIHSKATPRKLPRGCVSILINGQNDLVVPGEAVAEVLEISGFSCHASLESGHFVSLDVIAEIVHEQTGSKII